MINETNDIPEDLVVWFQETVDEGSWRAAEELFDSYSTSANEAPTKFMEYVLNKTSDEMKKFVEDLAAAPRMQMVFQQIITTVIDAMIATNSGDR